MTRVGAAGIAALTGFVAGSMSARESPKEPTWKDLDEFDPARVAGGLIGGALGALAGWYMYSEKEQSIADGS